MVLYGINILQGSIEFSDNPGIMSFVLQQDSDANIPKNNSYHFFIEDVEVNMLTTVTTTVQDNNPTNTNVSIDMSPIAYLISNKPENTYKLSVYGDSVMNVSNDTSNKTYKLNQINMIVENNNTLYAYGMPDLKKSGNPNLLEANGIYVRTANTYPCYINKKGFFIIYMDKGEYWSLRYPNNKIIGAKYGMTSTKGTSLPWKGYDGDAKTLRIKYPEFKDVNGSNLLTNKNNRWTASYLNSNYRQDNVVNYNAITSGVADAKGQYDPVDDGKLNWKNNKDYTMDYHSDTKQWKNSNNVGTLLYYTKEGNVNLNPPSGQWQTTSKNSPCIGILRNDTFIPPSSGWIPDN